MRRPDADHIVPSADSSADYFGSAYTKIGTIPPVLSTSPNFELEIPVLNVVGLHPNSVHIYQLGGVLNSWQQRLSPNTGGELTRFLPPLQQIGQCGCGKKRQKAAKSGKRY